MDALDAHARLGAEQVEEDAIGILQLIGAEAELAVSLDGDPRRFRQGPKTDGGYFELRGGRAESGRGDKQYSGDQRSTHDRLLRSVVLFSVGSHGLLDDRKMDVGLRLEFQGLGLFLGFPGLPQLLSYLVHVILRLGIWRNALVPGYRAFTGVVCGQGQALVAFIELHEVLQI